MIREQDKEYSKQSKSGSQRSKLTQVRTYVPKKLQGPITSLIHLDTEQLWRRHIDYLKEIGDFWQGPLIETEIIDVTVITC